jgi:hypothetical protein
MDPSFHRFGFVEQRDAEGRAQLGIVRVVSNAFERVETDTDDQRLAIEVLDEL